MKKFLAEAVANVVSAGFKALCKGELEEKEAKLFAARNIMANLNAIFREVIQGLLSNESLKRRVGDRMEALKDSLMKETDHILHNILVNLADSYPQATASGGTPRMRAVINDVNRVDDGQNDFIVANGIKISDYLQLEEGKDEYGAYQKLKNKEEGDYTGFIMKVINTLIEVTQDSSKDEKERTIFEKYQEFS